MPVQPTRLVRFTSRFDFLRTVLQAGDIPADELIGAFLRQAATAHADPYAFLVAAGRQLAGLLRGRSPAPHGLD